MAKLPQKTKRIELMASPADARAWRSAATRSGATLSDWIRRSCNATADLSKEDKGP